MRLMETDKDALCPPLLYTSVSAFERTAHRGLPCGAERFWPDFFNSSPRLLLALGNQKFKIIDVG